MVALQYTTSIIVLCDGSTEAAPWTPFHVTYGKVTTVQDTAEVWVHDPHPDWHAPRELSRHEDARKGSIFVDFFNSFILFFLSTEMK